MKNRSNVSVIYHVGKVGERSIHGITEDKEDFDPGQAFLDTTGHSRCVTIEVVRRLFDA